jgi:membrane protein implicated in regulation of membrane protease activity
MTLEMGYWIVLLVGAGFLLLTVVLGDIDFLNFLDFDIGDTFSATPVFFTAIAAFGGGGLLALNAFGTGTGGSVLIGLLSGIGAGALATGFFYLLGKQTAGEGFTIAKVAGERGRVTLAIQPGKEGRVAIQHEGMTRTLTATSAEAIASGEDVVVTDVVGNVVTVTRAQSAAPSGDR